MGLYDDDWGRDEHDKIDTGKVVVEHFRNGFAYDTRVSLKGRSGGSLYGNHRTLAHLLGFLQAMKLGKVTIDDLISALKTARKARIVE